MALSIASAYSETVSAKSRGDDAMASLEDKVARREERLRMTGEEEEESHNTGAFTLPCEGAKQLSGVGGGRSSV